MDFYPHANGALDILPASMVFYVQEKIALCKPKNVHVCDGSEEENQALLNGMEQCGQIRRLKKYKNCWLASTDPRDVARVESRTVICTKNLHDVVCQPRAGFRPNTDPTLPANLKQTALGNWLDSDEMLAILKERFSGCMAGRTMFVIPYMMGPYHCPYSKVGIEITDSPYVVVSMRIMTRMGAHVLEESSEHGDFIKCLHSVGVPLPAAKPVIGNWPCNPEQTLVTHFPDRNEIISFGSGYGGNSLCGKKCFALRIGSILAKNEGWLAEHMLIMGVTNPAGVKKYFCAAFPSACGKTNLAMLRPTLLPGYKIECVGDDIAWMHFDSEGKLRAVNPEYGFFGVAPGTSKNTNPIALEMIKEDTIFTNVAETSEGDVYWEGMENDLDVTNNNVSITSWKGKPWTMGSKEPAAHPNSRFCTGLTQCSILDSEWDNPKGVPIEAIIFGGRRPAGVPLIYECFNWQHGVFVGAAMRSEATAAAEHSTKQIMNDPFAMRPFLGYNFGEYLQHWLSLGHTPDLQLPRLFHVNWFLKDPKTNQFLWPGFGENIRIIDWIFRRLEGTASAIESPIGLLPDQSSSGLTGISGASVHPALLTVDKTFWLKEVREIGAYFEENVNSDLPTALLDELNSLEERIKAMPSV